MNLDDKIVIIKTEEGRDISDQQINDLIKEAGYNVANIEKNVEEIDRKADELQKKAGI